MGLLHGSMSKHIEEMQTVQILIKPLTYSLIRAYTFYSAMSIQVTTVLAPGKTEYPRNIFFLFVYADMLCVLIRSEASLMSIQNIRFN